MEEWRSKSIQKYLKTLKLIRFRVKPEEYEEMQRVAKEQGFSSMRQFFLTAIYERMGKTYNGDDPDEKDS